MYALDASNLDITDEITIEAVINASSVSGLKGIVGKGSNSAYELGVYNSVLFGNLNQGSGKSILGSTILSPNTVYHVALTYDGSNLKLYVNGVEDASKPVTGSINTNNGVLTIGRVRSGDYFYGVIDEVAIYDSGLSQTIIEDHYNKTIQQSNDYYYV